MIKQLVLALFLGSAQPLNLTAYNQLIKAAGQTVPPELAAAEKVKEVEADSAEAGAAAAKTAAVAKAATVAATSAAANSDPMMALNSGLNAPHVARDFGPELSPKVIAET